MIEYLLVEENWIESEEKKPYEYILKEMTFESNERTRKNLKNWSFMGQTRYPGPPQWPVIHALQKLILLNILNRK